VKHALFPHSSTPSVEIRQINANNSKPTLPNNMELNMRYIKFNDFGWTIDLQKREYQ